MMTVSTVTKIELTKKSNSRFMSKVFGKRLSASQRDPNTASVKGHVVSQRLRINKIPAIPAPSARKKSPTSHMFCSSSTNQNLR